jgi:quinone-modifying oxidoreductase subunit QmoC
MVVQENSRPAFLGKLVGEKSMFVLATGIPVILVGLLLYVSGWSFPEGPVTYSAHHLPPKKDGFIFTPALQVLFTGALLFAVISLFLSLKAYWQNLNDNNPVPAGRQQKPFVPSLVEALSEILPHSTFKDCEANNIRYSSHLLAFWGMIGLAVTTGIVAFNVDILGILPPSLNGPGTVPIKILGNVSAVAFIIGLGIMLMRRLTAPDQTGGSSYFDWFFIYTILGTGLTGLLTELFRWSGIIGGTYVVYTIHLIFVMALLLYLPFSKFAHIGYRTVAIAWSKSVGRNLKTTVQPNYVPPASAETAAE